MKNLDLNGLGVQEMNAEEMYEANGGTNDRPFGSPDYDSPASNSKKKGSSNGLIEFLAALIFLS